jgi:restriction endonuclease Mrr
MAVDQKLLYLLAGCSRPTDTQQLYRELADIFWLTQSERSAAYSAGADNDSAWGWRVRRAAQHLKQQGLLKSVRRGEWLLTPAGHKRGAYWKSVIDIDLDELFRIDDGSVDSESAG